MPHEELSYQSTAVLPEIGLLTPAETKGGSNPLLRSWLCRKFSTCMPKNEGGIGPR